MEEILAALDDLVRAGKVLYTGASSMYTWQFATMQAIAERNGLTKFSAMQNHYNLIYREEEREMIPYCRSTGVAVLPWSPLARGFLAGNRTAAKSGETSRSRTDDYAHRLYYQPSDFAVVDTLTRAATRLGYSNAQVALAWILAQPGVTSPIVGATRMSHLDDAIAALDIGLDDEVLKELSVPYLPHTVLGHS
jgi:aryl-alcohol dehydrogenase (NADP+)